MTTKSILFRLFRLGKMPTDAAQAMHSEGLILLEEGLKGSIILRKFKAPGRRHSYKHSLFAGSIALSEHRLLAYAFSRRIVNIPLADERFQRLEIEEDQPERLRIVFDANLFHDDWSGRVEIRYRTDKARELIEQLEQRAHGEEIREN